MTLGYDLLDHRNFLSKSLRPYFTTYKKYEIFAFIFLWGNQLLKLKDVKDKSTNWIIRSRY